VSLLVNDQSAPPVWLKVMLIPDPVRVTVSVTVSSVLSVRAAFLDELHRIGKELLSAHCLSFQ
jgi:hypothetical protein